MATWTPTPAEVKAVIPTRNGGAAFDGNSTPTATEVTSLANQVSAEIIAKMADLGGVGTGTTIEGAAKWAATLGTAAYVEQGFFPEQSSQGDQTIGQLLFARYKDAIDDLRRAIQAADTADTTTATASTLKTPSAVVADAPYPYFADELVP